ncbi:flagellar biosynthetic protein FliO [Sedimentibacter sp.]|uniref:flagellar biosynthetic protein FliO n=1 Tax=Sedimentibacter sp. TaxID=1960295 RepID=UPI0028A680D2|nr:flagellar biosynthetic protein FliO [Sedimentibacter sp.]
MYLTYYSTKWLSTRTNSAMKSRYINIVDKIILGQNKFLAIAEICSKYYLLSITEKDITIIKELKDFQPIPDTKPENNPEFSNMLNKFLKR